MSLHFFLKSIKIVHVKKLLGELNSEGIAFILLWCQVKHVIGIQAGAEPDKDNDGKSNKADAVGNGRKKGNQKYPKSRIVNLSNERERVCKPLFNRNLVS